MTRTPSIVVLFLFALPDFLFAQDASDSTWQEIRSHQPAALRLKLTLTKDHFFQGEKIDAALDFTNDDPKSPYAIWVGSSPCVTFRAQDAIGHDLVDPLKWILFGDMAGGMIGPHTLGEYTATLPVNRNVRFDQPGVYAVYAQSHVQPGVRDFSSKAIALVSDKTTITITPITPEQESHAIADALSKINLIDSHQGPDAPTRDGLDELKALQTPASRAELIKLVAYPHLTWPAGEGLEAAPNPSVEADRMMEAVKAKKLQLSVGGVNIYARLKTYGQGGYPESFTKATQEMSAALVQATQSGGTAHAEALWTAFEWSCSSKGMPDEKDPDGSAARKAVAEHQLELSETTINRLFTYWTIFGSADFLPLVRREVANHGHPTALIALCSINSTEARPLVLAEAIRPDSPFFKGYDRSALLSVTPMPLPELDEKFRSVIVDSNEPPGAIFPLLACFGSANLLPAALESFSPSQP